ncbi:GNAT family N-acetyltransferase [Sphingopyxis sp.]|uniref:GNAT family N-acetyltransferase n=1 Tax=Sphingopyxis sp. TaxID=1908224 RepID=UPI001DD507FA|nr:GNAT family N-acetyltransferase [Sphingopyxis sp.]MBW8297809.1 GNAT family N-acetyltransferase [Sphingopyxis sp.]
MTSQSIDAALSGAGEPHLATRGRVDLTLRPVRPDDAEVAISVVPAYQRRGFGWSLLHHLIDFARERGIACRRSTESRANRDAIEIERTLGFKSRAYEGDARLH